MKIPKFIEFHNNCYQILCNSLRESSTEENCAILIGHTKSLIQKKQKHFWEIKHIWPSGNIWGQEDSRLSKRAFIKNHGHKKIHFSKETRFEVNPKDQIAAQKWSRNNNLEILCLAHSHQSALNIPSKLDLFLHKSPGLMVISDKDGNLKAWWIENKDNFHQVKIEIFSLT